MAGTWPMWAHDRGGEYWNIGDKWWVELHGFDDPVVPVLVTEVPDDAPDGTHWGWVEQGRHGSDVPGLIWAFRGAFEVQFPYGSKAEEEAGHGHAVRLRITRS